MQQITLQPIPSQRVQVVLAGQNVQISVYLMGSYLFVDVSVNGASVSVAVIAQNQNPLVPTAYLGLAGNFIFTDTMGSDDPTYTGLGSRWQLIYFTQAEYASVLQGSPLGVF